MTTTRDRLIETAGTLFYEHGLTATGVDAVVRASGVTKPTLYAHFGSKEGLVAAVLERRHALRRRDVEERLAAAAPGERPLVVFDALAATYTRGGARGCAFLNAAAELPEAGSPARAAVQAEKAWLLETLVDACADAGCPEPAVVGSQLLLLVDGLAGRAVVGGAEAARAAVADARAAAVALVAAR